MKEDLGFYGNELVQLQTMYTVGAVVGMVPFLFLFTYIPMYWTIPAMDIMWGVFTLLQYRATSFGEVAAYRFFVGFFEVCVCLHRARTRLTVLSKQAAFFPAMHYVFGIFLQTPVGGQQLTEVQALGIEDMRSLAAVASFTQA